MTALLHFEKKVHCKDLARAEAIPLLMPRLLCQVLEHLGFPEEPRIERRLSCPQILSNERSLSIPLSFILQQQEGVVDDYAEELPRGEKPVPEVEVERTSVLDLSPPVSPPTARDPPETAGPSSTSQEPPEHIPGTSRDFLAVLDAVITLTERMARVEVTLVQNHAMLLQIQSHLGLPLVSVTEPTQPTTRDQFVVSVFAASLDVLAAAAAASDPPVSTPPRE